MKFENQEMPIIPTNSLFNPPYEWRVQIVEHVFVKTRHAPNLFHRWMYRLFFGIKWQRLKRNQDEKTKD